jgi:hypothetical protein
LISRVLDKFMWAELLGLAILSSNFELMNDTLNPRSVAAPKMASTKSSQEPYQVPVTLLDEDQLPLARGTATLPMLLDAGVFWPSCPMPASSQLANAKCFALPTGEVIKLRSLDACAGSPPHYRFWARTH